MRNYLIHAYRECARDHQDQNGGNRKLHFPIHLEKNKNRVIRLAKAYAKDEILPLDLFGKGDGLRRKRVDGGMIFHLKEFFKWQMGIEPTDRELGLLTTEEEEKFDEIDKYLKAVASQAGIARQDFINGMLRGLEVEARSLTVLVDYVCRFEIEWDGCSNTMIVNKITEYTILNVAGSGPIKYSPSMAYEFYEWNKMFHADLGVKQITVGSSLSNDCSSLSYEDAKLEKAADNRFSFFRYRLKDFQGLDYLFIEDPHLHAEPKTYRLRWTEKMNMSVICRDIVVGFTSILNPKIVFDVNDGANRHFEMEVGDVAADDQNETKNTWKLNRALLTSEVLAVRIRHKKIGCSDLKHVAPSGEIPQFHWDAILKRESN